MGRISIYTLISLWIVSCGIGSSTIREKEYTKTVHVPGGNFPAFGDSAFSLTMPDLEVMKYEVSNQSFSEFVRSTGYITSAEKQQEGMVFDRKEKQWKMKQGANWKNPQGPGSDIKGKEDHPVVQVSHEDACAFCEWLGMRLPTEVEWEYIYQLDAYRPAGSKNVWQGVFPYDDKGEDGFKGSSPVGYFGSGGFGCYDIQGNVWERCADFYHERWPETGKEMDDSARYYGPSRSFSENNMYDTLRVIKGGSFLCADNYCRGYKIHSRMGADPNLGYEHIGFRCVKRK